MQLYERVERLASQSKGFYPSFLPVIHVHGQKCANSMNPFIENLRSRETQEECNALIVILPIFQSMLPSLLDNKGLEQFEALSLVNPHLVIAHTTYHGCVLLLYSILSSINQEDTRARGVQFEAARSLADLYAQIRGARGITKVRSFVLPMVSTLTIIPCFTPSTQPHELLLFLAFSFTQ